MMIENDYVKIRREGRDIYVEVKNVNVCWFGYEVLPELESMMEVVERKQVDFSATSLDYEFLEVLEKTVKRDIVDIENYDKESIVLRFELLKPGEKIRIDKDYGDVVIHFDASVPVIMKARLVLPASLKPETANIIKLLCESKYMGKRLLDYLVEKYENSERGFREAFHQWFGDIVVGAYKENGSNIGCDDIYNIVMSFINMDIYEPYTNIGRAKGVDDKGYRLDWI